MAIRSEKSPVDAKQDGLELLLLAVPDFAHETALVDGLRGWWETADALMMETEAGYSPDEDAIGELETSVSPGVWGCEWIIVVEDEGWDVAAVRPLIDAEEAIAQFCAQRARGDKVARDWLQGVAVAATLLANDSFRTFLLLMNAVPFRREKAWERITARDVAERWGRVAARWSRVLVLLHAAGGEA